MTYALTYGLNHADAATVGTAPSPTASELSGTMSPASLQRRAGAWPASGRNIADHGETSKLTGEPYALPSTGTETIFTTQVRLYANARTTRASTPSGRSLSGDSRASSMRPGKRAEDRWCSIRAWSHTGPTLVPPVLKKVRAGTYNACSERVRRQGLEPRTRGLRVRCSVRLFSLNCRQTMLARAGRCHFVRSSASAPRCGYRMVSDRTGACEQTWSKHPCALVYTNMPWPVERGSGRLGTSSVRGTAPGAMRHVVHHEGLGGRCHHAW